MVRFAPESRLSRSTCDFAKVPTTDTVSAPTLVLAMAARIRLRHPKHEVRVERASGTLGSKAGLIDNSCAPVTLSVDRGRHNSADGLANAEAGRGRHLNVGRRFECRLS